MKGCFMDNELMLDVGQANELKMAFRRNFSGDRTWTNDKIKRLSNGDFLRKVLDVLDGVAEIAYFKHRIDCDADPFVPEGYKVEAHKKYGMLDLDLTKIPLFLSQKQKTGIRMVHGNDLSSELLNKSVLNANVLDYLLEHSEFIPREWKSKRIFFWGTIYSKIGERVEFYVRYLQWVGLGGWNWGFFWLSGSFSADSPVALASLD